MKAGFMDVITIAARSRPRTAGRPQDGPQVEQLARAIHLAGGSDRSTHPRYRAFHVAAVATWKSHSNEGAREGGSCTRAAPRAARSIASSRARARCSSLSRTTSRCGASLVSDSARPDDPAKHQHPGGRVPPVIVTMRLKMARSTRWRNRASHSTDGGPFECASAKARARRLSSRNSWRAGGQHGSPRAGPPGASRRRGAEFARVTSAWRRPSAVPSVVMASAPHRPSPSPESRRSPARQEPRCAAARAKSPRSPIVAPRVAAAVGPPIAVPTLPSTLRRPPVIVDHGQRFRPSSPAGAPRRRSARSPRRHVTGSPASDQVVQEDAPAGRGKPRPVCSRASTRLSAVMYSAACGYFSTQDSKSSAGKA